MRCCRLIEFVEFVLEFKDILSITTIHYHHPPPTRTRCDETACDRSPTIALKTCCKNQTEKQPTSSQLKKKCSWQVWLYTPDHPLFGMTTRAVLKVFCRSQDSEVAELCDTCHARPWQKCPTWWAWRNLCNLYIGYAMSSWKVTNEGTATLNNYTEFF